MFAYHEVATAVYKRAILDNGNNPGFPDEDVPTYQLPAWAGLVYLINVLFFLPLYIIVSFLWHLTAGSCRRYTNTRVLPGPIYRSTGLPRLRHRRR